MREWRLPSLLYADNLVLCGESEEDLRARWKNFLRFVGEEVVKSSKSKVMGLNEEDGLECQVRVCVMRLEHVSEFKFLGIYFVASCTDEAKCRK